MAEMDWFFSTLSQSVAASIGFIIAFTMSIYTSEQTKLRTKKRDIINEMRNLEGDISDVAEYGDEVLTRSEHEINEAEPLNIDGILNLLDRYNEDKTGILAFYLYSTALYHNYYQELIKQPQFIDVWNKLQEIEKLTGAIENSVITSESEIYRQTTNRDPESIDGWVKESVFAAGRSSGSVADLRLKVNDLSKEVESIVKRNKDYQQQTGRISSAQKILFYSFILFLSGVILPLPFLISGIPEIGGVRSQIYQNILWIQVGFVISIPLLSLPALYQTYKLVNPDRYGDQ